MKRVSDPFNLSKNTLQLTENTMRTLVIGDIHGAYHGLLQAMERANVTSHDHLIFLGDYCDGWSDTPKVFDLLIQLKHTHKTTFIKGNHDDLCTQFLIGKPMEAKWFMHGGGATLNAYEAISDEKRREHLDFINQMQNYHLDDKNRLFLHAGFTHLRGVQYEYYAHSFYWDRTLWETALATSETLPKTDLYFPKRLNLYNEIYIGHTPTTRYNSLKPIKRHNIYNIDTGAAFGNSITIFNAETKEFWQSDPVRELYPNEIGRLV